MISALTRQLDAQRRRRGDRRHDADRQAGTLQSVALLNVQFDEGAVIIFRELSARDRAGVARRGARLIE
jgi:hypothetical protein